MEIFFNVGGNSIRAQKEEGKVLWRSIFHARVFGEVKQTQKDATLFNESTAGNGWKWNCWFLSRQIPGTFGALRSFQWHLLLLIVTITVEELDTFEKKMIAPSIIAKGNHCKHFGMCLFVVCLYIIKHFEKKIVLSKLFLKTFVFK